MYDETGGRKTRLRQLAPRAMHEAAGAPPQLTDGACGAAQSTGTAASRPILQARPLALRLHRERAIVAKNTDLCAADLHGGRAQRRDNRRPRMLARKRTHRASCSPGGGRPSSPPERPCPGSGIKGGCFSPSVHRASEFVVEISRCRAPLHRSTSASLCPAPDVELYSSTALHRSSAL